MVGGEADAQQQEDGQGAVFLDPVHLAGDLVDPHEHRDQQRHQGVLGQKAGRNGQHGHKDEGKGLGALDAAEQDQADALVQAGLGHPHGHGQDAEDEEDRVGHVGLGDLFDGQDGEQVEHHPHHNIRGPDGKRFSTPQKRRQEQDGHGQLGHLSSLVFREQGFYLVMPPILGNLLFLYSSRLVAFFSLEGIRPKLFVDRIGDRFGSRGQFVAGGIFRSHHVQHALGRRHHDHESEDQGGQDEQDRLVSGPAFP